MFKLGPMRRNGLLLMRRAKAGTHRGVARDQFTCSDWFSGHLLRADAQNEGYFYIRDTGSIPAGSLNHYCLVGSRITFVRLVLGAINRATMRRFRVTSSIMNNTWSRLVLVAPIPEGA